ncbi:MAG: hypothetical protein LBU57_08095 [Dysgonamonadaceae bacterium]|jgi:hypothetical protein|nr:hypothetical protein [Dysgonamonadaceae bacterium]
MKTLKKSSIDGVEKKKLGKITLKSMEGELKMLTEFENRATTGGDGSGDCVFQVIAYMTGKSVQEVQMTFASYYNQTYLGGKATDEDAFWLVGQSGVASGNDMSWLMSQYNVDYYASGSDGIYVTSDGTNGHATYASDLGNGTYIYDAQAGGGGIYNPFTNTYSDPGDGPWW